MTAPEFEPAPIISNQKEVGKANLFLTGKY